MNQHAPSNSVNVRCQWILLILAGLILGAFRQAGAEIYEVGPNRAYKELDSINWPTLQAGDEVRIDWRENPYRTKIGIRARGTETAPILIVGLRGQAGERPTISGINATTPPSLSGFFDVGQWSTEGIGVITILCGPEDPWGYKPGYIEIAGLRVEGAQPDYLYTGMDGGRYHYEQGAAGIHANVVEHLTVRDCEITDNGNGFFVLSRNSEEYISRDILVEKNFIHGNGIIGSDQEHNIYTQASGIVFQYNRIGLLRSGAGGIALKDRSADTVIRYNWIVSGARTLDLVEPEDSYELMLNEPGFSDTWVYGNIITNSYSAVYPYATNMIHFGGDMGDTAIYRKGTLHFYHNTLFIQMNQAEEWDVTLFDPSTDSERVELVNNVFYRQGDADLYLARDAGQIVFQGTNWLSQGWQNSAPNTEWHTFTGTVFMEVAPLEGSAPGLADPAHDDFTLTANSALSDAATVLPQSLSVSHPVDRQYVPHLKSEGRTVIGSAADLGCFEVGGEQGADDPTIPALQVPVASITLNNTSDLLSATYGDLLSLKVAIDVGSYSGTEADWWLIAVTPAGIFSYIFGQGWVADLTPTYQGTLFSLATLTEVAVVPCSIVGTSSIYFGVDLVRDGELLLPAYYNSINLEVSL